MKSVAENRDCMEAMAEMPDKAFDLAIVDPPYGIGMDKKNAHSNIRDNPKWADVDWDSHTPKQDYFATLFRVSREQIIWGGNYFIPHIGRPSRGMICWDKTIHGNTLADCEYAWASLDRPARIYKENIAIGVNEGRIHPTQKSIRLYKWLLTNYAKQGDKILDTHLGSGSSRIAAYDLGFDFTGYELDKDYFDAQEQRFANHIAQPKLFTPESVVSQESLFGG
jgi:site-specific DNA-methyltransferase (adenine-specific)